MRIDGQFIADEDYIEIGVALTLALREGVSLVSATTCLSKRLGIPSDLIYSVFWNLTQEERRRRAG